MSPVIHTPEPSFFVEVLTLIESAQRQAYQAVNTALIELYWQVGQLLSAKIAAAEWGGAPVGGLSGADAAELTRFYPCQFVSDAAVL